eukprot:TRINITY_DN22960_c0_g1_i1.p1 TRINITY_DN22960_c0_g1~~TRINITY_DN22960_c0_g1_i1.p1  ORF type:complete len:401 (+),score=41.35 TRINITY_DN22960_c0_g1_i1:44-1246(+)
MNLQDSTISAHDVSECRSDSGADHSLHVRHHLVVRKSFIELISCKSTPTNCRSCTSDPETYLRFNRLSSDSSKPPRPSFCLPYVLDMDTTAESEARASNSSLFSCTRCGSLVFDSLEDRSKILDDGLGSQSFSLARFRPSQIPKGSVVSNAFVDIAVQGVSSCAPSRFGVNNPQERIKRSSTSSLSPEVQPSFCLPCEISDEVAHVPGEVVEGAGVAEANESSSTSAEPEVDDRHREGHFSERNPRDDAQNTTLLIKNLPQDWTRDDLFALLVKKGLSRAVDFLYIPSKLGATVLTNFRYGFANFTDHATAHNCILLLHGFSDWPQEVPEACPFEVSYSQRLQGLSDHVRRFRNSPVMHNSVEDILKPAVYADGVRIEFPLPTKYIKAPKRRQWQYEQEN